MITLCGYKVGFFNVKPDGVVLEKNGEDQLDQACEK
jgi:hypothetical protein